MKKSSCSHYSFPEKRTCFQEKGIEINSATIKPCNKWCQYKSERNELQTIHADTGALLDLPRDDYKTIHRKQAASVET